MAKPTNTSYAVLAMLARRPYSAYDLTNEIKRSWHQCMPRSETLLYREPKNLVARGWAVADEEMTGRRRRSVYSITEAGRRALAEWFDREAEPLLFESEVVVRMLVGHLGDKQHRIAALGDMERHVGQLIADGLDGMDHWIENYPPPADALADLNTVLRLYRDLYVVMVDWARWAREDVESRPQEWPEGASDRLWNEAQRLVRQLRAIGPSDDPPVAKGR